MSAGATAMPRSEATAAALAIRARRYLDGLDHPALGRFLAAWPAASVETRAVAPRFLPVVHCLPDAVAAAGGRGLHLVRALAAAAPRLQWGQTYAPEDFGVSFLERYGWTELVGTRGPLPSEALACGFLLLAQGTEYPAHSHDAEEIYIPLTGPASWMAGEERPWAARPPDEPIHHASGMTHAMRAEAVPLLALYLWRGGDLAQKSTIATDTAEGDRPTGR